MGAAPLLQLLQRFESARGPFAAVALERPRGFRLLGTRRLRRTRSLCSLHHLLPCDWFAGWARHPFLPVGWFL